jgi:GNAT superfamily N-acetyltransferase
MPPPTPQPTAIRIEQLDRMTDSDREQLTDVLVDCVEGGASVSFMAPLDREKATDFWRSVSALRILGKRLVLVARDDRGICGTVQVILDLPENQPHRGDIAKMLVHRRARRIGVAAALLQAAEDAARAEGRTLLVLDTVTGSDAERVYSRAGWIKVGDVPNYALFPDGRPCSTTFFYRDLD